MNLDRNDFKPIYYQISEKLRGDMEKGVFKAGEKLPPEEELAKKLNVSRDTIRSAFKKLEVEGWLFRVKGKGTFAAARKTRQKKLLVVSDSLPEESRNRNLQCMLAGVVDRVQRDGLSLQITRKADLPGSLDGLRNSESFQHGLLFMHPFGLDPRLFDELDKLNIPWLAGGGEKPSAGSFVQPDNEGAMRKLVDHLVDLGHRSFAVLSYPVSTSCYKTRLDATLKRLKERGVAFDEANLKTIRRGFEIEDSRAACEAIAARGPLPTAFICATDQAAVETVKTLRSLGFETPRDVSVAGFDNIAEYAQIFSPKLTTVDLDYFSLGAASADALLKLMDDFRNAKLQTFIELPLIVRESSGPAPLKTN